MRRRLRGAPPRLILYTSVDCGLCVRAKDVLAQLGLSAEEVDVADDHPYRLRTPVLEADGELVAEGLFDAHAVRRVLGV